MKAYILIKTFHDQKFKPSDENIFLCKYKGEVAEHLYNDYFGTCCPTDHQLDRFNEVKTELFIHSSFYDDIRYGNPEWFLIEKEL